MLNRRDIGPIFGYGLLFGAVVLWAALRPAVPDIPPGLSAEHESAWQPIGTAPLDLSTDQREVRGLARRMRVP